MGQKVQLLIIDPQNDFCEPKGSLFVPGADKDMNRLTDWVKKVGDKLDDVHVTMDCHHLMDIAHPNWWKDSAGNHPKPFTLITKDDVKTQKWTTTVSSSYNRALEYVLALDKNGKYPLCIWPPHCLIGSWGNNIYAPLLEVLTKWEKENVAVVNYVTKGSNIYTEHYSPLKADVPDPKDPSTQMNVDFVNALMGADILAIAGEAGSHCLANAIRDIVAYAPDAAKKIVLLKDATSPVPGFEKYQEDMISEMVKQGMKISSTAEFLL